MSRQLSPADKQLRKSIALRFIELREKTGKTQTEFAEDMDSERSVQNRLEKGRGATIYTINQFCKALDISISQFFDSPLFKEGKK